MIEGSGERFEGRNKSWGGQENGYFIYIEVKASWQKARSQEQKEMDRAISVEL